MDMVEEKIIKKVPGKVLPNPKERQGYIEDLCSKSKFELKELLERQDKILSNKSFVCQLPDKGERIKLFRERILKALAEKDTVDETCVLLSSLSLINRNVTDEIEWTGSFTEGLNFNSSGSSCEDDTDPIKILASNAKPEKLKKKKHRRLRENDTFLKTDAGLSRSALLRTKEGDNKDKLDVCTKPFPNEDDNSGTNPCNDLFAKTLCKKVDKTEEKKSSFKPHCTTKSGVHPGLFVPTHQNPHWEVTAATPPPPVHGAARLLTLHDSLLLQVEQAAKLKDIQARHAAEKLGASRASKLEYNVPSSISLTNEYRVPHEDNFSDNSSSVEDTDIHSDVEEDKGDTIVYTYTE